MQFLLIVDDPEIANFVSQNGVDRVFVDLEQHGKKERQGHLSTWISAQTLDDVPKIREAAPDCHLLVRINPLHADTKSEIDAVIAGGADSIMLPMFHTVGEVAKFVELVDGRALPLPLIETADALAAVPDLIDSVPLSEVYIGLNDLHLDLGMSFIFEPLSEGLLDEPCANLRDKGIEFGIGGIARASEGIVSPEFLLGEHVRLGSTRAILSRTFHRNAKTLDEICANMDFAEEVARLRNIYRQFQEADSETLENNRIATNNKIRDVVRLVKAKST